MLDENDSFSDRYKEQAYKKNQQVTRLIPVVFFCNVLAVRFTAQFSPIQKSSYCCHGDCLFHDECVNFFISMSSESLKLGWEIVTQS